MSLFGLNAKKESKREKQKKKTKDFLSPNFKSENKKKKVSKNRVKKLKNIVTHPQIKNILYELDENISVDQLISKVVESKYAERDNISASELEDIKFGQKQIIEECFSNEEPAELLYAAIDYHQNLMAESLIKKQPDLIHIESGGKCLYKTRPIFHAILAKNTHMIKFLVEDCKAPLNVEDHTHFWVNRSLLEVVFSRGLDATIVGYFLKKGAPVNCFNSQGESLLIGLLKTPLEHGLKGYDPNFLSRCIEYIELLVHYEINTNEMISGKTLLEYIQSSEHYSTSEFYANVIAALKGKKGPNFYKNLAGDLRSEADKSIDDLCSLLEESSNTSSKLKDGSLTDTSQSLHFSYMSGNSNNNNFNNNQLAPDVTTQVKPSLDIKYT